MIISDRTGLMWSRCLYGQHGEQCENGNGLELNWVDAVNKARASELSSYQNWRLPKIDEIETLLNGCSDVDHISPGIGGFTICSSTGNIDFDTKAWVYNAGKMKREIVSRDSEEVPYSFLQVRNNSQRIH